MTKTGANCMLVFYYHIYGSLPGTLLVNINYKGSTTVVFEVSDNMGDKWNRAQVGLGALDAGE